MTAFYRCTPGTCKSYVGSRRMQHLPPYQSTLGASSCIACAAGTYATGLGSTAFEPIPHVDCRRIPGGTAVVGCDGVCDWSARVVGRCDRPCGSAAVKMCDGVCGTQWERQGGGVRRSLREQQGGGVRSRLWGRQGGRMQRRLRHPPVHRLRLPGRHLPQRDRHGPGPPASRAPADCVCYIRSYIPPGTSRP